jgi:hypothetical protein
MVIPSARLLDPSLELLAGLFASAGTALIVAEHR